MGGVSRRSLLAELLGRAAEVVADSAGVRLRTLDELETLTPGQIRRLVLRPTSACDPRRLSPTEIDLATRTDGEHTLGELLEDAAGIGDAELRRIVVRLVGSGTVVPREPLPEP